MTTPSPAVHLPNFFLAGVSKAGTTSLHRYLAQHPQVFMSPIKGPMFFGAADLMAEPYRGELLDRVTRARSALERYLSGPQAPGAEHFVLEWDDYVRLFRDVRAETVIGESSTGYFWLPSAPAAIRARIPRARFAFVLRDPAERLFTLSLPELWNDPAATFSAWYGKALREPLRRSLMVSPGRYATHLQRFAGVFGWDQMRVYLYEDLRADPRAVLRDLFTFLGVRADQPIDMSRRHHETVVPRFPRLHAMRARLLGTASLTRWLPPGARRALRHLYARRPAVRAMNPADRGMVIDYYREEIQRTADLLDRDLSAWLR